MLCYISRNYRNTDTAGNKAKTDYEKILAGLGARNIGLPTTSFRAKPVEFAVNLAGVAKALFTMRRGDVVVLQYPVKKYYSLICRVVRWRGARTVTFIHDLGSCRRRKLTEAQEIKRLSHTDVIMAHNPAMQRWLAERGSTGPTTAYDIHDYLSASSSGPRRTLPAEGEKFEITYAGTLAQRKNSFLYDWHPDADLFTVNLYGNGFNIDVAAGAEAMRPMGFVRFDELIAGSRGHFGLVWDGDSVKECSGSFGEYLKLNNPHKISLYLRCGLPVLVWRQAAMAPFLVDNGVGIAIDSLDEIPAVLRGMTAERYAALTENVEKMSRKIADGEYFAAALRRATSLLPEVKG